MPHARALASFACGLHSYLRKRAFHGDAEFVPAHQVNLVTVYGGINIVVTGPPCMHWDISIIKCHDGLHDILPPAQGVAVIADVHNGILLLLERQRRAEQVLDVPLAACGLRAHMALTGTSSLVNTANQVYWLAPPIEGWLSPVLSPLGFGEGTCHWVKTLQA